MKGGVKNGVATLVVEWGAGDCLYRGIQLTHNGFIVIEKDCKDALGVSAWRQINDDEFRAALRSLLIEHRDGRFVDPHVSVRKGDDAVCNIDVTNQKCRCGGR